MTVDRAVIVGLALCVIVEFTLIQRLYGVIAAYQMQFDQQQTEITRQRNLLDEFNRKLAAAEVKYEFCIDLVRKQQKGQ